MVNMTVGLLGCGAMAFAVMGNVMGSFGVAVWSVPLAMFTPIVGRLTA